MNTGRRYFESRDCLKWAIRIFVPVGQVYSTSSLPQARDGTASFFWGQRNKGGNDMAHKQRRQADAPCLEKEAISVATVDFGSARLGQKANQNSA